MIITDDLDMIPYLFHKSMVYTN